MKETLDIVRRAMEIKTRSGNLDESKYKDALDYARGQLQILEYIIKEKGLPETLANDLLNMYTSSLSYFYNWNPETQNEVSGQELKGAADILSWILDISQDAHIKNLQNGQIVE